MTSPLDRPQSSLSLHSRIATPEIQQQQQQQQQQQIDNKLAELPIIKTIDAYEHTLNSLLASVALYNPNIQDAEQLVKLDSELRDSLQDLVKHRESGLEIQALETRANELGDNCKKVLLGLGECRAQLASLSTLDTALAEQREMQDNKVSAGSILQYAMKLSKFTRAPESKTTMMPADFVWPSERLMRSGMLAIASLKPEEVIGGKTAIIQKTTTVDDKKEDETTKTSPRPITRRGSFGGAYGDEGDDGDNDVMEDLDLFDPDDL